MHTWLLPIVVISAAAAAATATPRPLATGHCEGQQGCSRHHGCYAPSRKVGAHGRHVEGLCVGEDLFHG